MQNNDLIIKDYDEIEEIPGYSKLPLGRAKDLRTQKFNRLTPLYRTKNQGSKTQWCCKCDCGNYTIVTASHLQQKITQSCGCIHTEISRKLMKKNAKNNAINLTNQKFGKLTAIECTFKRGHGGYLWKCQCDCGNIAYVGTSDLTQGHTKSCGCGMMKDLTNQKFGKLTVLYKIENKRTYKGGLIWRCLCDCGNFIDVNSEYLLRGDVKSCGCLKHASFGEIKIKEILQKNNISFIQEKTFENCVFLNSNKLARFDFFIKNYYIIEYDGIQHFQSNGGWNTEDKLQLNISHDEYKNQWCKENNIPLIRIPYWHYDDLCIEDLQLETTQFRVV